jgi:endonuclease YncB( thermonuclease family)
MGGWAPIVLVGVLSGAALEVRAEGLLVQNVSLQQVASRCGIGAVSAGRVARILDGRSFVLDDRREIRLALLEVPPVADSPSGEAARAALAALLASETIEIRPAAAMPDRYGRTLAHVFIADNGAWRSVTHALLAAGHARVNTQGGDSACAAELLSQERVARSAKIGLWGDPQYAIMSAGNLAGLVAERGRFAVIEGKVLSVRESGGTIYVNFGRRWSQALTVTISKRQERIFTGAGITPKALESRRVRVRGWVEVRNGPRIEASRPEQIEFVDLN